MRCRRTTAAAKPVPVGSLELIQGVTNPLVKLVLDSLGDGGQSEGFGDLADVVGDVWREVRALLVVPLSGELILL